MTKRDLLKAIDPIDKNVSWDEAYELVVHNDSETPIEFVVELLMLHFLILQNEAASLALRVHSNGKASIGRLTQACAQEIEDSMLQRISERGFSLRIEASRWSTPGKSV